MKTFTAILCQPVIAFTLGYLIATMQWVTK